MKLSRRQHESVFTELHQQFDSLAEGIDTIETKIVAHARGDETARRLATIPGIGPITASLIAATVADICVFKSARLFAAWLDWCRDNIPPGGKTRLGRITKAGNREIRRLLVLGATSMVYRAEQWNSAVGAWTQAFCNGALLGLVTVALAMQDGAHRPAGVDDARRGLRGEGTDRGGGGRGVMTPREMVGVGREPD